MYSFIREITCTSTEKYHLHSNLGWDNFYTFKVKITDRPFTK